MKRTVKKFDKYLNLDTATPEKIKQVNQELYKYLETKGEKVAAKQVDYLIKNQSNVEKPTVSKPNPVYDRLMETNNQILDVLRKLQAQAFDEQDTSIKKTQKVEKGGTTVINNYYGDNAKDAANDSGLDLDFGRRRKGGKTPKKGTGKATKGTVKGTPKVPSSTPPATPSGTPAGIPTGGKDSKVPTKTSEAAKDAAKQASKVGGKAASKGASILGKMAGFLKPIPILGTAIAAATAAYAAVDGWENASAITGIPEENLTDTHKLAAAAGSVVSDFTFGVVGADTVAHQALKFAMPSDIKDTLKKYTDEGIIEDNTFSHDDVLNWRALEKLPAYEIEKIIQIDDWSEEDKKKLWEANKRAAVREATKSNEQYMTQDGATKSTSTAPQVQSQNQQPSKGTGTPTTESTGGAGASKSTGAGTPVATGSGKYAGVSGSPIPNAEQSKAPIVKVEDFGPGWNVVKRADGSIEKRIGNRNWRNNNPGNIEFGSFTQKFNALQGDPRFAIFPTYDDGRSAKRELIFYGKNYTNLSLSQAIARYAPPTENNTASYAQSVLGAVGLEKIMKDYTSGEQDTILNAMQRIEGWVVGRVELIEKGSPEKGLQAIKEANEKKAAAAAASGTGGSPTTPMNVNKGGELSGPASVKKSSSGVSGEGVTSTGAVATAAPSNTSDATSSKGAATAVANKSNREAAVQQSNTALVMGTKQYDAATSSVGSSSSSTSNTNINNSKPPRQDYGQDSILNYFT